MFLLKISKYAYYYNIYIFFHFPTLSFNPKMTIRDIVCEPLLNFKKIKKSEKDAVCRKLLEMVELPGDFADRYPHNMSGGQRQRVAIARALAKNPELLLCDEPTGALDYATGKSVLKLLHDLSRERHSTVIIITHNQAIAPMADRIIRIKSGRILSNDINRHVVPIEEIEW